MKFKFWRNKQIEMVEPVAQRIIINTIKSCTIDVYFECLSGNKNGLIVSGEFSEDERNEAWSNICREKIDIFGLNEKFINSLVIQKRMSEILCDFIQTNDPYPETEYYILKKELEEINQNDNNEKPISLKDIEIFIYDWRKEVLTTSKDSIYKLFIILESIAKEHERLKSKKNV